MGWFYTVRYGKIHLMKNALYSIVSVLLLFVVLCLPSRIMASDEVSSTSAIVVQNEESVSDLTVPKERVDRMNTVLATQKVDGWVVFNPLKYSIRKAVESGVSVNTLVLLFFFPLVATMVAFSRQVIGLNGFGMISPALLGMAFLSTGGGVGMVLLGLVLMAAILGRMSMKKIKIPYLPKLAMLIWIISFVVLVFLISLPQLNLNKFMSVGIFPIVIFVMIAETFIEAQITRNMTTSFSMLVETVILALVAYKIMSSHLIQAMILLNPEFSTLTIVILDLIIGRYKGLRLLEMWRFRKLIVR